MVFKFVCLLTDLIVIKQQNSKISSSYLAVIFPLLLLKFKPLRANIVLHLSQQVPQAMTQLS